MKREGRTTSWVERPSLPVGSVENHTDPSRGVNRPDSSFFRNLRSQAIRTCCQTGQPLRSGSKEGTDWLLVSAPKRKRASHSPGDEPDARGAGADDNGWS